LNVWRWSLLKKKINDAFGKQLIVIRIKFEMKKEKHTDKDRLQKKIIGKNQ